MKQRNDWNLISLYRTPIMGAAALWIYVFHEWEQIFGAPGVLYSVENFIKGIGFCGVDFFFFLSGMGLVYAIEKYSVLTFYKRRMERVFMPYLLIALAMMVARDWSGELFLKNLLGYNFLFSSIYTFLWFVPAILILYLFFPVYHRVFRLAPDKGQFTAAVLLVWLFLSLWLEANIRYDVYGFTNRIPVFLIGVLVGWCSREREVVFTKLSWILWILVFGVGLYLAYKTGFEGMYLVVPGSNCCIPNMMIAVSGSCLAAKLFSVLDRAGGWMGKGILKFLGFFGKLSLELYCTQEWIGGWVRTKMRGSYGNLKINAATFLCVMAATLALHGLCRLIDRLWDKCRKGLSARKAVNQ